MLKNYELLYILHPDLEGSSDKVTEKVAGFIKKVDGEITNQEDWGKRKMAYKIAKNDFGVYVLVNFSMDSEKLPEVERDLRLSEEVIRFLVVAIPEETRRKPERVRKTEKKSAEKPEVKEEIKEEKKAVKTKEKVEKAEKPAKATTKKAEKVEKPSSKKESVAEEKERMKKLDEKLEEILGE